MPDKPLTSLAKLVTTAKEEIIVKPTGTKENEKQTDTSKEASSSPAKPSG